MDRIRLKSAIMLEAQSIIESHPSKDARHLAQSVLDYFKLERQETLSLLSGSVTEKELKGQITPGCKVNR